VADVKHRTDSAMSTTALLFCTIVQGTKAARKKTIEDGDRFDGQRYWSHIKELLTPYDHIEVAEWVAPPEHIADPVLGIPEHDADGRIIEPNHFIRQHVNIRFYLSDDAVREFDGYVSSELVSRVRAAMLRFS